MDEERECNTCEYYDPMEGVCVKTQEYRHGYEGTGCPDWKDWEDKW